MQFSGYPEETRYKVIKKAIDKYEKEIEATNRTGNRRFIPSIETRKERLVNKATKKKEWSRREGKYESVMFVQATENSKLKNKIQNAARKNKIKVKVQERSGTKIKGLLQRSDPFSNTKCKRMNCIICTNQLGINCRARG